MVHSPSPPHELPSLLSPYLFIPPSPQATDQTFLQKLHHELSGHKDYIKGADKRLWPVQFGIKHYAGPVTYMAKDFLEKNKDVQQELFFDYLEHSTCDFVKDITRYRVCHSAASESDLLTSTTNLLGFADFVSGDG